MDTLNFDYNFALSNYKIDLYIAFLLLVILLTSNMLQVPIYANDYIANKAINSAILRGFSNDISNYNNIKIDKELYEKRINEKFSNTNVETLSDGIKHISYTKYFAGKPVNLNLVIINKNIAKNFEIKPALANGKIASKATITSIAKQNNSIVAINGGFFKPTNGMPLGTMIIDNKIYSGPIYDRVAIGITEKGYETGRISFNTTIKSNDKLITVDNINQQRTLSTQVILYTHDWGNYSPTSPKYGVQLQVAGNRIIKASANPLSIPQNGYVIVGPKSKLSKLFGVDKVENNFSMSPQWEDVKHVISGGPYLVKKGNIFVDTKEQNLLAISGKNPRTAIGYTSDNDLILLTADGREGHSVGLTLYELANYMQSIGCIYAINLDGGGSTVMYINGKIVNHPTQKGGILLSNALVISPK